MINQVLSVCVCVCVCVLGGGGGGGGGTLSFMTRTVYFTRGGAKRNIEKVLGGGD